MKKPIPSELAMPDTAGFTILQDHVRRMTAHFQWTTDNTRKVLLLVEEIGELAKAIRRMEKIGLEDADRAMSREKATANLEEELADVLNYILDIANGYGVDLGKAYADKMTANLVREWK
ncbi:MAG: putative pyrophosphatase [Alphaproteobacteria bacterium]|nr:putative pyrophosphatase [Alphaproteobacteria bacterium]